MQQRQEQPAEDQQADDQPAEDQQTATGDAPADALLVPCWCPAGDQQRRQGRGHAPAGPAPSHAQGQCGQTQQARHPAEQGREAQPQAHGDGGRGLLGGAPRAHPRADAAISTSTGSSTKHRSGSVPMGSATPTAKYRRCAPRRGPTSDSSVSSPSYARALTTPKADASAPAHLVGATTSRPASRPRHRPVIDPTLLPSSVSVYASARSPPKQHAHLTPPRSSQKSRTQSSYGFRPGRSAHDAVLTAREYIAEGKRWIVDMDLEKFFDRVNHDLLMARVARKVRDKRETHEAPAPRDGNVYDPRPLEDKARRRIAHLLIVSLALLVIALPTMVVFGVIAVGDVKEFGVILGPLVALVTSATSFSDATERGLERHARTPSTRRPTIYPTAQAAIRTPRTTSTEHLTRQAAGDAQRQLAEFARHGIGSHPGPAYRPSAGSYRARSPCSARVHSPRACAYRGRRERLARSRRHTSALHVRRVRRPGTTTARPRAATHPAKRRSRRSPAAPDLSCTRVRKARKAIRQAAPATHRSPRGALRPTSRCSRTRLRERTQFAGGDARVHLLEGRKRGLGAADVRGAGGVHASVSAAGRPSPVRRLRARRAAVLGSVTLSRSARAW